LAASGHQGARTDGKEIDRSRRRIPSCDMLPFQRRKVDVDKKPACARSDILTAIIIIGVSHVRTAFPRCERAHELNAAQSRA